MSLTPEEAKDEILSLFKLTWDAGLPGDGIVTTGFPVHYPDIAFIVPTAQTSWLRLVMKTINGGQVTLAGDVGTRRFNREGFIMVQIFTPSGQGQKTGLKLTKLVMSAFEGKATAGGVWFRRVRFNEIGIDGSWYQINVLTDFNYDEVK